MEDDGSFSKIWSSQSTRIGRRVEWRKREMWWRLRIKLSLSTHVGSGLWLRFGLREKIPSWNRREGGKWYASNDTHNSNTVPWIWGMVSKDF